MKYELYHLKSAPVKKNPAYPCGKARYRSKKDAQTKMNEMNGYTKKADRKLKIYPCGKCKGWHMSKIKNYFDGRKENNHRSRHSDQD